MATSSSAQAKVIPLDAASDAVAHSIWLDGPRETADGIGARGYAYAPYAHAGPPVAIEPHVLILYVRGRTTIDRTIGRSQEHEEVGPGDLSLQSTASPAVWGWAQPIEVLHIYISPVHLRGMARRALRSQVSAVRLHNQLRVADDLIAQLGYDLIRELALPRAPGAEIAARAIGDRLLVQLLRSHAEIEHGGDQAFDDATAARLHAYIAEHLADTLELDALARVTGYGVHHFCRLFRHTFGQAPHDYVRERRLDAARSMLASSTRGISEIALACGFADQSHLTRCFKQQFGVTPARWRRATT
jgi:AraC family transcriptional regulator